MSVRAVSAGGIKAQQDEQKHGESEKGGSSVAEKWQRYAYHRAQSDHHADVYASMENQYGDHTIGVDTLKNRTLSLGYVNKSQYQREE